MLTVCKEHDTYGYFGIAEVAKKELRLINEYSEKYKKCAVCDEPLNEDDTNKFTTITFWPCCKKHKSGETALQLSMLKDFFSCPENTEYNESNWKKYLETKNK